MILRARQEKDVLVFELEGQLDFETTQQFHQKAKQLIAQKEGARVVFNMDRLKFVGSSGINQFIRVLKNLNSGQVKPRYCNLSSEFDKLFKAFQTTRHRFEIFENESMALQSFEAASDVYAATKKSTKSPTTPKRKLKTIKGTA